MTIKESAKEIEAFLNSDFDFLNDAPNMKEFIFALELALSYMKCMVSDNPLTLEQLREMDGRAVRVFPKNEYSELGGVCVVSVGESDEYSGAYIPGVDHWYWSFDSYNEQWLAYAYQPAHIDREAWKPCWTCRSVKSEPSWGKKYKYCPHCGRPLTPDAWDALEKQIR